MAKQWQFPHRHKLFLVPRGTFKTTIWTISGSIFEIINNPNVRILISNANLENSKTILKGIREHFIHNERFRALYPDVCPQFKHRQVREFGTQLEFTVPSRNPGIKESTIEVGSVEGNLVSRHYDMHIGDDLVNDKNTTTKEQIDKVDNFRKHAYSLLEPNTSREILIGTVWHWDDIYCRIINEYSDSYHIYRRAILENKDGEPDLKGGSIFKKRFPKTEIRALRKKQSSRIFACQYMNQPVADEDALFKAEWIDVYQLPADKQTRKDFLSKLYIVTAIDPAVSDKRYADNSGFVTIGVGPNDETYVLEAIRRKMNPLDMINLIFTTFTKWRPVRIGIEAFAFQTALKYFIKEEMRRRKQALPIRELDRQSMRSKSARIESLQPRVEHCDFYVTHDMTDLVDEMIRYPKAKHDDLVDALAYTEQLRVTPAKRPIPEVFQGERFIDLMKRHKGRNKILGKIGGHRMRADYG